LTIYIYGWSMTTKNFGRFLKMAPKKTIIFVFALVIVCLSLPESVLAIDPNDPLEIRIAATMREYQARYIYLNFTIQGETPGENDYLTWPAPCYCSSLEVPYPPNSYYKYCVGDPNSSEPSAVELVQSILDAFWGKDDESTIIYDSFIHKYWDPNELDEHPSDCLYEAGDFSSIPETVDSSDYNDVLNDLYEIITDKFIYIIAENTGVYDPGVGDDPNDGKAINSAHDNCGGTSCSQVKGDANEDWTTDGWTLIEEFENCDIDSNIRVHEITTNDYTADKWALRGKLDCNLVDYNGDAKWYVGITRQTSPLQCEGDPVLYDDWSNMDSGWTTPSPSDVNYWEPWETVSTGGYHISGFLANFEPTFVSSCPAPEDTNGTGWYYLDSIVRVEPDFDTTADGWSADSSPSKEIFKKQSDYVYAANKDCDTASKGEVVDGNVVPAQDVNCAMALLLDDYNDVAGKLYVGGWDADKWYALGEPLTEPNKIECISCGDVKDLRFSVRGYKMRAGPNNVVDVNFRAIFLRNDGSDNIKWSEKEITMKIKANEGDICCREDACVLTQLKLRNGEQIIFCSYHKIPKVWTRNNGDVEVRLPDYQNETFIMYRPSPDYLSQWGLTMDGTDIYVTYKAGGRVYEFTTSSPYKLHTIQDLQGNTLINVIYDEDGRLHKQEDASDPSYYIAYDYNDLSEHNDVPESITLQADDVNRVYTLEYDAAGRITAVTNGACGCGGDGGSIRYVFDENDRIKQERTYDTNEVIYEYVRDASGRVVEKWLGSKDSNDCIRKTSYGQEGGTTIVDTYSYVDANNYRVAREYRNGAGHLTKRVQYANLNEDPNNPSGESYATHMIHYYDANGILTKKVVIPPVGEANDPNSGIRKEYNYDPNTGRLLTEKWYDRNDVNFTKVSNSYDYIMDGNDVVDARLSTTENARGAVTSYYYDGNSTDPNLKVMPEVSTGISGTLQLKYEYEYDPNRGWLTLEKQLDMLDNLINQTKYEYDDYGNLIKRYDDYQGDHEEVTEYTYNAYNERIKAELPSGVLQGWFYNNAGRVTDEVVYDPCNTSYLYSQKSYTYDGNGRLVEIAEAKDPNTFLKDSPEDGWIYTKYEYDLQGNRTKVIEDVNDLNLETTYEYNNQGEVTKVTLPIGKWTKTYYNGRGLVSKTEVGHNSTVEATTTYYYNDNGNLEWEYAPDGTWKHIEYDDFGRKSKVTKGMGS